MHRCVHTAQAKTRLRSRYRPPFLREVFDIRGVQARRLTGKRFLRDDRLCHEIGNLCTARGRNHENGGGKQDRADQALRMAAHQFSLRVPVARCKRRRQRLAGAWWTRHIPCTVSSAGGTKNPLCAIATARYSYRFLSAALPRTTFAAALGFDAPSFLERVAGASVRRTPG